MTLTPRNLNVSLIAVTVIAVGITGEALAQTPFTPPFTQTPLLCASDEQLKRVLIHSYFSNTGIVAGVCAGRFPVLLPSAQSVAKHLETTYHDQLGITDLISVEAYEQHYPGRGREIRDTEERSGNERWIEAAKKWTRAECEKHLAGMEWHAASNNWNTLTAFPVTTDFPRERARVPTCQ